MVGAHQPGDNDEDVEGEKGEGDGVPSLDDESFKVEIRLFAAREDTVGITNLGNGGFHEGAEIPTAP